MSDATNVEGLSKKKQEVVTPQKPSDKTNEGKARFGEFGRKVTLGERFP